MSASVEWLPFSPLFPSFPDPETLLKFVKKKNVFRSFVKWEEAVETRVCLVNPKPQHSQSGVGLRRVLSPFPCFY